MLPTPTPSPDRPPVDKPTSIATIPVKETNTLWWVLPCVIVFCLAVLWTFGGNYLSSVEETGRLRVQLHGGKYDPSFDRLLAAVQWCEFYLFFIAAAAIKYLFTSPRRG
jgi:hypothetical protein